MVEVDEVVDPVVVLLVLLDEPLLVVVSDDPLLPSGGGGGGGIDACMKLDSSLWLIVPSPSLSMVAKADAVLDDVDDELAVEVVEDVDDVPFSCTPSRALRVALEKLSTKLCSSVDDTPPEESESMVPNSAWSGSVEDVEDVADDVAVAPALSAPVVVVDERGQ